MELVTLDKKRMQEVVAALPVGKLAAFSKAAKAALQHVRDAKMGYEKAFDLACVMVENWWLLGRELESMELSTGGRPPETGPLGDRLTLDDLGLNKNQSSRCQQLSQKQKENEDLQGWLESQRDADAFKLPTLTSATHVANNSGVFEWYTPAEYVDAARECMGGIELDPASCKQANEVVKADRIFTQKDDALTKKWTCRTLWLNPPYAVGVIDLFMDKLADEYTAGNYEQACCIVNNATETRWFQDAAIVAAGLCLPRGRVRFYRPDDKQEGAPLQGQAVLYFGKQHKEFKKSFAPFGLVFRR